MQTAILFVFLKCGIVSGQSNFPTGTSNEVQKIKKSVAFQNSLVHRASCFVIVVVHPKRFLQSSQMTLWLLIWIANMNSSRTFKSNIAFFHNSINYSILVFWVFRVCGAHSEWTWGSIPITCAKDEQIWNGGLWAGKLFYIHVKISALLKLNCKQYFVWWLNH